MFWELFCCFFPLSICVFPLLTAAGFAKWRTDFSVVKDAFFCGGKRKEGGGCNCTHHLEADILQFLFVFSRVQWKVSFAHLGLVEEIELVFCRGMRNCINKDLHSLWLDWYPQGTSLLSQDRIPSYAAWPPWAMCSQDFTGLVTAGGDGAGSLLVQTVGSLSVFRVITADTMRIEPSLTSPGAGQVLGSVTAWECCADNASLIYFFLLYQIIKWSYAWLFAIFNAPACKSHCQNWCETWISFNLIK